MAWISIRSRPESLTARIREAEQQLADRRQGLAGRAAALVRKIHEQLTSPASLLLAGGLGFMTGELTRQQRCQSVDTADAPGVAGTSPLNAAINLFASARTLYTALPLAWLMKSFRHSQQSDQARDRQSPRRRRRPVEPANRVNRGAAETFRRP